MPEISIAPPPGFRFRPTVQSHGWYRLAPFRWDEESAIMRRAETFDGERVVDLEIAGNGEHLRVATSRKLTRAETNELHKRLRRMFQLDLDLAAFHEICAARESHRAIARAGFGRLLCGSTLFEDVVKIIATTNTTWRQTVRMVRLLVERYGPHSRSGFAAFPTPEIIAEASPADLKEHCRMGYRADSLSKLSRGIASGEIDLEAISNETQTTEELFESYMTLPGIGPYGSAHLLAMDGRHDFIAVDTEFRRFVRERYHRGRKIADRTLLRRYNAWGKWKYLAYWSELWEAYGGGVEGESAPQ